MNIIAPIILALIAATGNAIFVAGLKQSAIDGNRFAPIVFIVFICSVLSFIAAPAFGNTHYNLLLKNWVWLLIGGVGLFIAYIGFSLLHVKYGASSYILYAVLSIVTTGIILGGFILKESLNFYHWLAVFFAILTVIFFSIGNHLNNV